MAKYSDEELTSDLDEFLGGDWSPESIDDAIKGLDGILALHVSLAVQDAADAIEEAERMLATARVDYPYGDDIDRLEQNLAEAKADYDKLIRGEGHE